MGQDPIYKPMHVAGILVRIRAYIIVNILKHSFTGLDIRIYTTLEEVQTHALELLPTFVRYSQISS